MALMPDMETFFASAEEHAEVWKERKMVDDVQEDDDEEEEDAAARARERMGRRVKLMVTAC